MKSLQFELKVGERAYLEEDQPPVVPGQQDPRPTLPPANSTKKQVVMAAKGSLEVWDVCVDAYLSPLVARMA